ncbi:MAG: hypothetical protein ABEJ36_04640 [Candidatus Nanosalina sp.]
MEVGGLVKVSGQGFEDRTGRIVSRTDEGFLVELKNFEDTHEFSEDQIISMLEYRKRVTL